MELYKLKKPTLKKTPRFAKRGFYRENKDKRQDLPPFTFAHKYIIFSIARHAPFPSEDRR